MLYTKKLMISNKENKKKDRAKWTYKIAKREKQETKGKEAASKGERRKQEIIKEITQENNNYKNNATIKCKT